MKLAHTPREFALAIGLFAATLVSTLWVGAEGEGVDVWAGGLPALWRGAPFAIPLLAILVSHEFGHYFAARSHGVPSSLPLFIPMPYALIGTFGAVIRTSGRIGSRNALLDIGAAGPLAGLVVALPVLIYGLATSEIKPLDPHAALEGRSLLYVALLRLIHGSIPAGHDIYLNATAFAGWAGLLVTMMNLVPTGQLDGGHVAYALLGTRQNRYSRHVRTALLICGLTILAYHAALLPSATSASERFGRGLAMGGNWLVWWLVISIMARTAGEAHADLGEAGLSRRRVRVALATLCLFPLLFMPTWLSFGATPSDDVRPPASLAPRAR